MHCPPTINFAQDYIDLIRYRPDVLNAPSISDIPAAIVLTPNRPNYRLNVRRFEAISSVVVLETSGTITGGKLSREVRNGNPNAIISRDLNKENCDHSATTGCSTAN
jgi:hypothetical protein